MPLKMRETPRESTGRSVVGNSAVVDVRGRLEMAKSAWNMSHTGERSVELLEKLRQGTSTSEGIAISWIVVQELSQRGADNAR